MATLRVREAFAVPHNGISRVMRPGDLVHEKDPIVKGREAYFEPVEAAVSRDRSRVEQATSAPGEKRTRTAPQRGRKGKKAPAKKTAAKKAAAPPSAPPSEPGAPAADDAQGSTED